MSELFSTRYHEVVVGPDDFERLWPLLTWHRDGPISEPSDVASYRLASRARDHVKVLLSGEGRDELFAGYPKYAAARLAGSLSELVPRRWRARLRFAVWSGRSRFAAPARESRSTR